jgi:hypothetical protein
VAPRPRTDLQTTSWRMLREEWAADSAAVAECEEWERERSRVRPQMAAFLHRFLGGGIGLEQFRSTFDRRTRTDWDAFALKGASGAMFLNALVKHTDHRVVLARQLRAAFRAPENVDVAATRLADLIGVIAPPALPFEPNEEADNAPEKPVFGPTHAVFFATMCWHLQAPDQWPAFQPSSRRVLHDEEELFTATGDPVHDYLLFREAFLSLGAVLSMTTWQLEHLCWWQSRQLQETDEPLFGFEEVPSRGRPKSRRPLADTSTSRLTRIEGSAAIPLYRSDRDSLRRVRSSGQASPTRPDGRAARNDNLVREAPPPYVPFTEQPALDHTHVQWLLAKVGKQLGCRVWIAANDWHREWGGEPLGSLSVRALPRLGLSVDSQRLVSLIDVVWLTGVNQVAAAFEVEHTTSVYSGLLRMADLAALSPNLNFPLYVVAPASRLAKVRRELMRPTFRTLGLDRRCRFFSSESLIKALPNLARWATGPDAIEKLAESAMTTD